MTKYKNTVHGKCEGFKLNSYDATYDRAVFEVVETEETLEITEVNSGMIFLIRKNKNRNRSRSRSRSRREIMNDISENTNRCSE